MSTARQTRGGSKDQAIAGARWKVANRRLNSRSHPANNGQGNIVEAVTSTEARTRDNTEINDPAIIASQAGPAGVVAGADKSCCEVYFRFLLQSSRSSGIIFSDVKGSSM
jgi:hypothetical protein